MWRSSGAGGPAARLSVASPPAEPGRARLLDALLYGFKRDLNQYIATSDRLRCQSLAMSSLQHRVRPGRRNTARSRELSDSSTSPGSADTAPLPATAREDIMRSRGAIAAIFNGPDGRRAPPTISTRCSFRGTAARARRRRPAIRASSCRAVSTTWRRRSRSTSRPGRRDVFGTRVQRAAADRACLRVRAGDALSRAAGKRAAAAERYSAAAVRTLLTLATEDTEQCSRNATVPLSGTDRILKRVLCVLGGQGA